MTYYDSAAGTTITLERAYKELKDHGSEENFEEMVAELCPKGETTLDAQALLEWLGY